MFMQQMHSKINKWKRIKVVSPGCTILFYLMMQQQMQKTCFLNVGRMRKSQIAVIMQASWHNNSIFKYSIM